MDGLFAVKMNHPQAEDTPDAKSFHSQQNNKRDSLALMSLDYLCQTGYLDGPSAFAAKSIIVQSTPMVRPQKGIANNVKKAKAGPKPMAIFSPIVSPPNAAASDRDLSEVRYEGRRMVRFGRF